MGNRFEKEIVKYYMDFIETDFHKRRTPKRKIVYSKPDNLVVGCNTQRFPKFERSILDMLKKQFSGKEQITVQKGMHTVPVKIVAIERIVLAAKSECAEAVSDMNMALNRYINILLDNENTTMTVLLEDASNAIQEMAESALVDPFLLKTADLFDNAGVSEQDILPFRESIVESVTSYAAEVLSDAVAKRSKDAPLKGEIPFITIEILAKIIKDLLNSASTADLFIELSQMNASKKLLEKQEFYLSIFDITYNKDKYPLFYIPVGVTETVSSYTLDFEAQLFINKKALEYIAQETHDTLGLAGSIQSIRDRIVYLSDNKPLEKMAEILDDILTYFKFEGNSKDIIESRGQLKNSAIAISGSLYLNVFDQSDDALVNDYEELLQHLNNGSSLLSDAFEEIIEGFMAEDPVSVTNEVEELWDDQPLSEKLVFQAPVPLNEEQIKILNALQNDTCKHVIVQGPPGTGKSHTITAIVFDMILKDKSVLVLSDKKEALDVVEDKITSTLNKVRTENDFQNPILRLGKTGSTYGKILSVSSINAIRSSYKILKSNENKINEEIQQRRESIMEEVSSEESIGETISVRNILEFEHLEDMFHGTKYMEQMQDFENEEFQEDYSEIRDLLNYLCSESYKEQAAQIAATYKFDISEAQTDYNRLSALQNKISSLMSALEANKGMRPDGDSYLKQFQDMDSETFVQLTKLNNEYYRIMKKMLPMLLHKKQILALLEEVKIILPWFDDEKHKPAMAELQRILKYRVGVLNALPGEFKDFALAISLPGLEILKSHNEEIEEAKGYVQELNRYLKKYPKIFKGFDTSKSNGLIKKYTWLMSEESQYDNMIRFVELRKILHHGFGEMVTSSYISNKRGMQENVTLNTIHLLDGRVLEFYDNNKNTASTLKKIIQKKGKFPKSDFGLLKKAFPCILAGIRDYADYIPLETDLFDLIIIDEASQVSVAQAMPALIRGKKILVLGDKMQFSNVKSNQAKSEINNEYKAQVRDAYLSSPYRSREHQVKLENFDIRSSILDFFEFTSNYQAMLNKYFRGYKEIISYSNKHFYKNKLQVMKIRGKSIADVLVFTEINHDGKLELVPKSNRLELEAIKEELLKLLEQNYPGSVGIITPHTNQRRLLFTEIRKMPEYSELEKRFNLKIMTFDTCQGEERDIIIYSMVAHPGADSLYGVFLKDMSELDLEEDGKIKAQRLNVGFSRAKEKMHFFLSKPIDEYSGEIGNALRHYQNELAAASKQVDPALTDPNSAMEAKVLDWIYKTDFWTSNHQNIELLPQFELGRYLKQLDETYTHPFFRVDFLLLYEDNDKSSKIIIEYDGFREHFLDLMEVDANNYEDHYKPADIYRQKTLESYGYRFLRINRFNVGENPVDTLDGRLKEVIHGENQKNSFRASIVDNIKGLQKGEKRICQKCNKLLDIEKFRDDSLKNGYGRTCMSCKEAARAHIGLDNSGEPIKCQRCGANMILRKSKYGRFYGCARYPSCTYTMTVN